jgi:hypothetical protein
VICVRNPYTPYGVKAPFPVYPSRALLNHGALRVSPHKALRSSNEFFNLQAVLPWAASEVAAPSAADARSILSLAKTTLICGGGGGGGGDGGGGGAVGPQAWRRTLALTPDLPVKSTRANGESGRDDGGLGGADALVDVVVTEIRLPPLAPLDAAAAGAREAEATAPSGAGGAGAGCEAPLALSLRRMGRVNHHHAACWKTQECNDRRMYMYLMEIHWPLPPGAKHSSAAGGTAADNARRAAAEAADVPTLRRLEHKQWMTRPGPK